MAKKFEYMQATIRQLPEENTVVNELNQHGRQGWEVCYFTYRTSDKDTLEREYTIYLKREYNAKKAEGQRDHRL